MPIRKIEAVTVIVAQKAKENGRKFLLTYDPKWGTDTWPVGKIGRGETKEDAAMRIVSDLNRIGNVFIEKKPEYLCDIEVHQQSRTTGELTRYVYSVFLRETDPEATVITNVQKRQQWVSWERLTGKQFDPGLCISPTVSPTAVELAARGFLPFPRDCSRKRETLSRALHDALRVSAVCSRKSLSGQIRVKKPLCRSKPNTFSFDIESQTAFFDKFRELSVEIARNHGISMDLSLQGEEGVVSHRLGKGPNRDVRITLDPCDGSSTFRILLCSVLRSGFREARNRDQKPHSLEKSQLH